MALSRSSTDPYEAQLSPTSTICSTKPLVIGPGPWRRPSRDIDIDIEKHAETERVTEEANETQRAQSIAESSKCSGSSQADMSGTIVQRFDTRCRSLEECPRGYPLLGAFLSSDLNFALYRRFGYLRSRLLLVQQQELDELEEELDALDKKHAKTEEINRVQSWESDRQDAAEKDEPRSRVQIFADVRAKLEDYDELLLRSKEVESMHRPSNRDYRSVRRFFSQEAPLIERETEWVKRQEDMVTLRPGRECAGFDLMVESLLWRLDGPLVRYLFMTKDLRQKTTNTKIYYYSPERINTLVGLIITAVIFVLLIIPVVVMYSLTSVGRQHSTFQAIGVLVVFTLVFGAAMSLLTRAKRHELFAASAAYCAVLVVFISNFSGNFN